MARAWVFAWGLVTAAVAPAFAADGPETPGLVDAQGSPSGLVAWAEGPVDVTVTVIHAKKSEGGVAPELAKIEKYLHGSFPEHKSFVRLSSSTEHLAIGAQGQLELPNGSKLVFRHTGWKNGFVALHLDVGGLLTTVNVKDGATFFQAGRAYQDGMIVLVFQVQSAP